MLSALHGYGQMGKPIAITSIGSYQQDGLVSDWIAHLLNRTNQNQYDVVQHIYSFLNKNVN